MNPPRPHTSAELRVLREYLTPPTIVLPEDATLDDLVDAFATHARSHTAYLTTSSGLLAATVPFRKLRKALHPRYGARFPGLAGLLQRAVRAPVRKALDCATRAPGVTLHTPIRDALFQMDLHKLTDLPIVDAHGKLVLELKHDAHAKILRDLSGRLGEGPTLRAIPR